MQFTDYNTAKRIDYILVPQSWTTLKLLSYVEQNIHAELVALTIPRFAWKLTPYLDDTIHQHHAHAMTDRRFNRRQNNNGEASTNHGHKSHGQPIQPPMHTSSNRGSARDLKNIFQKKRDREDTLYTFLTQPGKSSSNATNYGGHSKLTLKL